MMNKYEKVDLIKIDGNVILKIIKHCRENFPDLATGQLLGLDENKTNVIEVTYSFPQPNPSDDDEEIDPNSYQLDMMKYLREMNVDSNNVGWYASSYLDPPFFTLFHDHYQFQTDLPRSILITYDPISTTSTGSLALRAYRLTDKILSIPTKSITRAIIQEYNLSFTEIFEEIPIEIMNTGIMNAMISELSTVPQFKPTYSSFDLKGNAFIEKNLERVIEDTNYLQNDQMKYRNWSSLYSKYAQILYKRQQENAQLRAEGKPTLPESMKELEAEFPQTFKSFPEEPNRLESLLISEQIHHFCKQIISSSTKEKVKLSLLKALKESTTTGTVE